MADDTSYCHMPEPCSNCPFRREGGVRLREARIRELAANAPAAFPCHKTVNRDRRNPRTERECAGAIMFAYNADVTTQMLRISERLGKIDPAFAAGDHEEIFDSVEEMLETAEDRERPARKARR